MVDDLGSNDGVADTYIYTYVEGVLSAAVAFRGCALIQGSLRGNCPFP